MRNAFWVVLIVGSLAAILGGYLQGLHTANPPPTASLRTSTREAQRPPPARRASPHLSGDRPLDDLFARDDVVVDRTRDSLDNWHREQLAVVVGLCGESVAAQSGFLRLGVPVAFVVDPHAAQAAAFAKLVRDANQTLLVHVGAPPNPAALAKLQRALGSFDGIASRDPRGMAQALRGTPLIYFDEVGTAQPDDFSAAGVALMRRDVTADDLGSPGYVAFMLGRAAALSRRVGTVVVLMRPLPSSLEALRAFGSGRDVTLVALH